jgi:hypothetical protein
MNFHKPPIRYAARVSLDAEHLVTPQRLGSMNLSAVIGREDVAVVLVTPAAPPGVRPQPRPGLLSPSTGLLVGFYADGVEVTKTPVKLDASDDDWSTLTAFAAGASRVLGEVLAQFERRAYRFALLQESVVTDLTPPSLDRIGRALVRTPSAIVARADAPFEWDWRIAHRGEVLLGGRREATNEILSVKRQSAVMQLANDAPKEVDGLFVSTDCNTSLDDSTERFAASEVKDFFAFAIAWHTNVLASMDREFEEAARHG